MMQFPAEAVRQHANTVGEAAEQMALARSAIRAVGMDRQAYGQICQFLPALLDPLFDSAVDVLSAAVDSLSETSYRLRATAETIEATDVDSAHRIAGVQPS